MSRIRATATSLGVVRAWVCGVFLLSVLHKSFVDLGHLPATVVRPTGVLWIFPWGLYDRLLTPTGMMILKVLLVAVLVAATIGYLTPWSTKGAALLMIGYQGLLRSLRSFNHDEMLGLYILAVLAFTPCGDGFSVDRLSGPKDDRPRVRYGYPLFLMQLLLVWVYFAAGASKLQYSGLSYFNADNLAVAAISFSLGNLAGTDYDWAFALPRFRSVLPIALVGMVAWELLFPLALFVRRTRWWFLGSGVVFHSITGVLMNVFFKFTLAMYGVFVDWVAVGRWLLRFRPVRQGWEGWRRFREVPEELVGAHVDDSLKSTLLWDGECGLCGRSVDFLRAFARRPVRVEPFQQVANLPRSIRQWSDRQMHWIDEEGRVFGGSRALIEVLDAAGHGLLAAILESSVVRPFVWLGYRLVAENRSRIAFL